MNTITRRQLIQLGLGTVITPLLGWAADRQTNPISAESYLNGGMKGFAIDTVERRGNDLAYFEALAATGANVGRIFFPFKKFQQLGGNPANVAALRRILDWAFIRKFKIVIVGVLDDQDKPSFWNSDDLRESFVENWEWFAKTYQNDPSLAGLDLMNEPNPPRATGKLAEAHALWQPLAERAIAGIRAAGVVLPIIYEGVGGGQAIGLRDFEPFKDGQVVYSIHVYTPHAITHQHVGPAWPRTIPYPAGPEWQLKDSVVSAGGWDRNRLELALKDVIVFQQRYKVPIYVGEFSCVRWAPDGSALRYIADCLSIFKQFGWSWCYHEFRGWPGWDAEIASEERNATTRSPDSMAMKLIRAELAKS